MNKNTTQQFPSLLQSAEDERRNLQKQHEESGCTDYLQHNAENCPHMKHCPDQQIWLSSNLYLVRSGDDEYEIWLRVQAVAKHPYCKQRETLQIHDGNAIVRDADGGVVGAWELEWPPKQFSAFRNNFAGAAGDSARQDLACGLSEFYFSTLSQAIMDKGTLTAEDLAQLFNYNE